MFKKATKEKKKLRLAIDGPSGAGKTYSALAIASGLGQRIALIDSERGSARMYADDFAFDVVELEDHHPANYIKAITAADQMGYEVLIIDSLSHAWSGKNGALELVDKATKAQASQRNDGQEEKKGNSFTAWRTVTPVHNSLVDAILSSKCHVICTMRVKTAYIMETVGRSSVPKKVGVEPIQRDGVEYEFDVVADINHAHELIVSKTRITSIDGEVILKPDMLFGQRLRAWLESGAVPAPRPTVPRQETVEQMGDISQREQLQRTDVEEPLEDPDKLIGEEGYNAMLTELGKKHDDVYNWFIKHHPEAKGKRIIDFFTVADRAVLRSKVK